MFVLCARAQLTKWDAFAMRDIDKMYRCQRYRVAEENALEAALMLAFSCPLGGDVISNALALRAIK